MAKFVAIPSFRLSNQTALLLLALLGLILYLPTVQNPYVYDDFAYIVDNPSIRSLAAPWRFFTDPETLAADKQLTYDNYRPLFTLSTAIIHHIAGPHAAPQHAANTVLHLLNTALLFLLLRRRWAIPVAMFASALFLIHPVQVEPVAWASCRSALLSMTFTLAAFHYHVRQRSKIAWVFYALAVLSKETAVVFPALGFVWDRLMENKKRKLSSYMPYIAVGVGLFVLRTMALHRFAQTDMPEGSWLYGMATALGAFLTTCRLFVFPHSLTLDYTVPIIRSLTHWKAIAGGAVLVLLVSMAWRVRHRFPAITLGLAWMLIALLPTSNIIPLKQFVAERFLYLSMAGAAIAYSAALIQFSRATSLALCSLSVIALTVCASSRLIDWRTNEALYRTSLNVSPTSVPLHFGLGLELASKGDLDGAETAFSRCLQFNPRHIEAALNLARLQYVRGDFGTAVRFYERAISIQPSRSSYFELAVAARQAGAVDKALNIIERLAHKGIDYAPLTREKRLALDAQKSSHRKIPPLKVEQIIAEAAMLPIS
jgi:protein O-mannosyl-transferase